MQVLVTRTPEHTHTHFFWGLLNIVTTEKRDSDRNIILDARSSILCQCDVKPYQTNKQNARSFVIFF
jgi:hypothetical protein